VTVVRCIQSTRIKIDDNQVMTVKFGFESYSRVVKGVVCLLWILQAVSGFSAADESAGIVIPLAVQVHLVGYQSSRSKSQWNELIAVDELAASLKNILSAYFPATVPDRSNAEDTDVRFEITYNVEVYEDDAVMDSHSELVRSCPTDSKTGLHLVPVQNLSAWWTKNVKWTVPISPFILSVVILSNDGGPARTIVSDTSSASTCTQSILSNVAIFDLFAKPCDLFASMIHEEDASLRWSSFNVEDPYPFVFPVNQQNPGWYEQKEAADNRRQRLVRLCGVVTSAVQALAAGDISIQRLGFDSEKIFVPVIILRNSGTDASTATSAQSRQQEHDLKDMKPPLTTPLQDISFAKDLNISLIKQWAESMLLPHQEVVIVSSIHFIDEHPALAISLAAATDTFLSLSSQALLPQQSQQYAIPYLNSARLVRELKQFGSDDLFHGLLSASGHGEAVSVLRELQAAEFSSMDSYMTAHSSNSKTKKGSSKMGSATTADEDKMLKWFASSTNRNRHHYKMSVLPIIVLSDMHKYYAHLDDNNSNLGDNRQFSFQPEILTSTPAADGGFLTPVQPLFDRVDRVTVVENTVLVMHSSGVYSGDDTKHHASKEVLAYSPLSGDWRKFDLSNLNALIASGLSRGLTGMTAPHIRPSRCLSSKLPRANRIDVTWTHGVHPFQSYGVFDGESVGSLGGEGSVSVLAHKSQRTAVLYRLKQLISNVRTVDSRVNEMAHEIIESIGLLDGQQKDYSSSADSHSQGSFDANFTTGKTGATTIEDLIHPTGIFQSVNLNYSAFLSDSLVSLLVAAMDEKLEISAQLAGLRQLLLSEVGHGRVEDISLSTLLTLLLPLEDRVLTGMRQLDDWERHVVEQLSHCKVQFAEDVASSQRQASLEFQQPSGVWGSSVHRAILAIFTRWMRKYVVVLCAAGCVLLAGLVIGAQYLMKYLEGRAKKIR
jgi:hypothetical protein